MSESLTSYSIDQFILARETEQLSYDKLSLYEKTPTNTHLVYNVIHDYYDELVNQSIYLKLSDDEYNLYKYKPKLLAYKLYGDPEMFFILLALNNICNIKEFNFKRLRVIHTKDFSDIMSAIYNSEYDLLAKFAAKNGI